MERKKPSLQSGFDCTHHIHACLMHANGKKNAFDRTSYSSWQPTGKVQMAFITKEFSTLSRWRQAPARLPVLPSSIERCQKNRFGNSGANELVWRIFSFRMQPAFIFLHLLPKNDATVLLVPTYPFLFLRKEKNEREKFVLIFCTFFSKFRSLHTWKRQTTPDSFYVIYTVSRLLAMCHWIFLEFLSRLPSPPPTLARLIVSGRKLEVKINVKQF